MTTVLLLSLAVLTTGCAGWVPLVLASTQASSPPAAILRVTLEGTEFKWSPGTVVLRPGQRVQFLIMNKGTIEHTFVSVPARVPRTAEIPPAGRTTVEWTAPSRNASFEFLCDVPGHREAGMVGRIVVN